MKIKNNYSGMVNGAAARFFDHPPGACRSSRVCHAEMQRRGLTAAAASAPLGHEAEAVPSHGEPIFGPNGLPQHGRINS